MNFPFLEIKLNRGLKIGHININRLYNKLDGIRSLLDHFRFDILAISETWLKSDVLDSEINIEGYSICRKDRSNDEKLCGGGTLIYIRNGLPFETQENTGSTDSECLGIKINRTNCKPLYVCRVYRLEQHRVDLFIDSLKSNMSTFEIADRNDICLLGDFNIDYSKQRNQNRRLLEQFASQFGLTDYKGVYTCH